MPATGAYSLARKLALITFWLLAAAGVALAAVAFKLPPIPSNLNAGISQADEAYNPQKGMGYFEVWTLWAIGEDGTAVIAQFVVSNTGFQNSFPGYNVTVALPGQKPVNTFKEFDAKTFTASREGLDVRYTNVELTGRHPNYRVKLGDPKIKFDLAVKATSPGVRLGGDGRIRFGKKQEDFFKLVLLAPEARVTGTVTVAGKTHAFAGVGYSDHETQDTLSTHFSDRWNSIRFFNGKVTVTHTGLIPSKGYTESYIGQTTVIRDGRIRHVSLNAKLVSSKTLKDPKSEFDVPQKFLLSVDEPGCKLLMDVPVDPWFERIEVLGRLNPVTRRIIGALVAKPYIYRFKSRSTANIDLGDGEQTYTGDVLAQTIFIR